MATPSQTTCSGEEQRQLNDEPGGVRHGQHQRELRAVILTSPRSLIQPVGSPTAAPITNPTSGPADQHGEQRQHGQRAVVEDAGQEDVLGPTGPGGHEGGDRGRNDRARPRSSATGAGSAGPRPGSRRHRAPRREPGRAGDRPPRRSVKATNGSAASTIPRTPTEGLRQLVADELLDVAELGCRVARRADAHEVGRGRQQLVAGVVQQPPPVVTADPPATP